MRINENHSDMKNSFMNKLSELHRAEKKYKKLHFVVIAPSNNWKRAIESELYSRKRNLFLTLSEIDWIKLEFLKVYEWNEKQEVSGNNDENFVAF